MVVDGIERNEVDGGRHRWRRVPPTPALDGLRGVAIAAVALFHFPTHRWLVGGLFGVGVFFVLSGFLVTPIIAEEHQRSGAVRLGRFYRKRGWRLLPALLVFLAVFLVLAAAFGRDGWFQSSPFGPPRAPGPPLGMRTALGSVGATLGYVYNFFLARRAHLAAPLGHMWTLSVEGQFYLVWAIVMSRVLRWGPGVLLGITVALIGLSSAAPFLYGSGHQAQAWIYFSTAPRVQELLGGSLLAQLWARGYLGRLPEWLWKVGGTVGAGLFTYLLFGVANVPLKYWGALTLTAVCGVLIVGSVMQTGGQGLGGRVLASPPLVWLGKRSYAVYLWHWPLAMWTNELPHDVGVPLGIGMSLVLAELSWRLVERPAQRWGRSRESARTVAATA